MQVKTNYKDVPAEIRVAIKEANLFYSEVYEANALKRGQQLVYLWSDYYILVARIKQELFLKAAILETEPFKLMDGGDEKKFVDAAMMSLKNIGVQWVVVANTARFQVYPSNASVVPTGNHIVDLTLSKEELWTNVHSKHRNSIKRGEKSGIELKIGGIEFVNDYAPLANVTYSRSAKKDAGEKYYKNIMSCLDHNAIIMLAYKGRELQSAGMFYYNKEMAYYLHGASVAHPEPGSTNYLLWEAMMYFKTIGVKKFSFVGYHYNPEPNSKLDGIQRFKERFGGVLERSYNFKCVFNKLAYFIYGFVMQIKIKKPYKKYQDAIDLQIKDYPELNQKI